MILLGYGHKIKASVSTNNDLSFIDFFLLELQKIHFEKNSHLISYYAQTPQMSGVQHSGTGQEKSLLTTLKLSPNKKK